MFFCEMGQVGRLESSSAHCVNLLVCGLDPHCSVVYFIVVRLCSFFPLLDFCRKTVFPPSLIPTGLRKALLSS